MAPSIKPVMSSTMFLVTCLALLAIANALMLYGYTNYPTDQEGFINYVMGGAYPGVGEGFSNYNLGGAAAGNSYGPIGIYDNVVKTPKSGVSAWRATAPNEPMAGPEFKGPGPDNLFMFKNNQCKPECCGASFSCSGGCVCTTPDQRQMIASRGGNRTAPEDGI
jgi:hypothetical protein